jgi:RNA polymerase sigma factor (sigma-70 family)
LDHAADMDLVHQCLLGDDGAVCALKDRFNDFLVGFLVNSGAMETEASDIVGSLWADCIFGSDTRAPRLQTFRGQCSLASWLKRVTLNQLIDRRRRTRREEPLDITGESRGPNGRHHDVPDAGRQWPVPSDQLLLAIMRDALQGAFAECAAADFVMLRLVYLKGVSQREIAKMWGWNDAKVSRKLQSTMDGIAEHTLRAVKARDPWLELTWEDFLELCEADDSPLFE